MLERRKYVRIAETLHLAYEIIPNNKVEEYLTKDISQGGIRFLVHEFIPKNSLLKIRLTLQNATFYLEVLAKVMWINETPACQGYEVGVEFQDMPQRATEYLLKYIQAYLKP